MPPTPMFTIIEPKAWPAPPSAWHFSLLKEIETCPRQWALSAAAFPDLWDGSGYPPAVNTKALTGQVIHATISRVCVALAHAGCKQAGDANAVEALRTMGGFTAILRETIDRIIDRHRTNPRLCHTIERVRNDLLQEIPTMRQQVQRHLHRVTLMPRRPSATGAPGGGSLREGSYHELHLRAESLGFIGIVDLLQIESGQCTIWEFKTGAPDDRHTEQLRTYALLWAEDKNRNPDGIPVRRMMLSYNHHVQELQPSDPSGLLALRAELAKRISAAASAIRDDPPQAHPDPERCRFCDVRQLCPEYWAARATWHEDEGREWGDVEARIGASRGPRSWDAVVIVATGIPKGTPVVLVLAHTSSGASLCNGMQVRLLNVRQAEIDGAITIGISTVTEIFSID
jgi:CRISPR/Cas system-associated exonuclease Cas4 (RecB family)